MPQWLLVKEAIKEHHIFGIFGTNWEIWEAENAEAKGDLLLLEGSRPGLQAPDPWIPWNPSDSSSLWKLRLATAQLYIASL